MNYSNQAALMAAPQDVVSSSELSSLHSSFTNLNQTQEELLYTIQDRLHGILNLRVPEKEQTKQTGVPTVGDFVSSMRDQLGRMDNNCSKLSDILSHLNKIIG